MALHLADEERVKARLKQQGQVRLSIDGMQPDVGHEVLWIIRDCLSGEVLLARTLLSSTRGDLAALLGEVKEVLAPLNVPIKGIVSDGQQTIRQAVERSLPGVPHQLCHFHYLDEAAGPIFEADRHAKTELKKLVRGVQRTLAGLGRAGRRTERGHAPILFSRTQRGSPMMAIRRCVPRVSNSMTV